MNEIEKTSKIPKRGRPKLSDYVNPEDLPDRIRDFCKGVVAGLPPIEVGQRLDPPAGKQQIDAWLDNTAVTRYIGQLLLEQPEEQAEKRWKVIEKMNEDLYDVVIKQMMVRIAEDKATWNDLHKLKERHELMRGVVHPAVKQSVEAEEEKTILDLFKELPEEERKKIEDGKVSARVTKQRRKVKKSEEQA
jgi:hypothetical protein